MNLLSKQMSMDEYMAFLREESYEMGVEEGRAEAKAEGIIEGKMEVAKRMMQNGFSVELVTSITGFTKEQVMQWKH